jgi:hypothetical protein
LRHRRRIAPPDAAGFCGSFIMQDLLWIGVTLGLLAASLAYVRLCDMA